VLALYNATEQPFETDGLGRPAFHMLDHILSSMSLATLDGPSPAASTAFLPEVESVASSAAPPHSHSQRQRASTLVDPSLRTISASHLSLSPHSSSDSPGDSCHCSRVSLPSDSPVGSSTLGRDWLASPRYHPYWTEARIAREQIRILVWSACVPVFFFQVAGTRSTKQTLFFLQFCYDVGVYDNPGCFCETSRELETFKPVERESQHATTIRETHLHDSILNFSVRTVLSWGSPVCV
jgi:hypothetical protein